MQMQRCSHFPASNEDFIAAVRVFITIFINVNFSILKGELTSPKFLEWALADPLDFKGAFLWATIVPVCFKHVARPVGVKHFASSMQFTITEMPFFDSDTISRQYTLTINAGAVGVGLMECAFVSEVTALIFSPIIRVRQST